MSEYLVSSITGDDGPELEEAIFALAGHPRPLPMEELTLRQTSALLRLSEQIIPRPSTLEWTLRDVERIIALLPKRLKTMHRASAMQQKDPAVAIEACSAGIKHVPKAVALDPNRYGTQIANMSEPEMVKHLAGPLEPYQRPADMEEVTNIAIMGTAVNAERKPLTCPRCTQPWWLHHNFCSKCGLQLPTPLFRCSCCGTRNFHNHCGQCGRPTSAEQLEAMFL